MNEVQIAGLLDRFGTAYRAEIPAEALELWHSHLKGVELDVAVDAAENIIGVEVYFPTVATFQKAVGDVIRYRAQHQDALPPGDNGPNRDCGWCSGTGSYEVDDFKVADAKTGEMISYRQERFCPACKPREAEAQERYREERRNRSVRSARKGGPDELYEYNPKAVLAEARRELVLAGERAAARQAAEEQARHDAASTSAWAAS